jgi:hypothetical protein
MRQAHEGGERVKMKFAALLMASLPALAAITGTVTNGTTGKPASGAMVVFYKFGQGGMQEVDKAQADAQGKFSINQTPAAQGPSMLRVELDGITYNHLMPPGSPATDIPLQIYNATKQQPAGVQVSKHMILFEPSGGKLNINETFIVKNNDKITWADTQNGTLHFFLPAAAGGSVDAKGSAPDGMPVDIPTDKTSQPDTYTAKFELKPGETRFDVTYSVPYTEGTPYAGKIASKDQDTYLIAPNGITMAGDHLKDLGVHQQTQAHIYGLEGTSYEVKLTGTEVAAPDAAPDQGADNSGPQIEQIMPRIYSKAKLILPLALTILALGFILLYRKEPHERSRG